MNSESIPFEELLMTIPDSGPVMEIARKVSRILVDKGIDGAVIGGVAVVLHGHVRTTVDVDVFTPQVREFSDALRAAGFAFDAAKKEFVKDRVPVHLITSEQVGILPKARLELSGVRTVSLEDLINIKLRSASENMLRAKDLGDVIELIRHHRLGNDFSARIDANVRPDFRKLVRAIQREHERH